MVKKDKNKNKITGIRKDYVLWVAIAILFVSLGVCAWYIAQLRNTQKLMGQANMARFIAQVEEQYYKYPVIDVTEARVYMPELRSYLPLNATTRDLRYNYQNGSGILTLSLFGVVGHQSDVDDPQCDQIVHLKTNWTTKQLTYYSTHDTQKCKVYLGHDIAALTEAAKAIKQY